MEQKLMDTMDFELAMLIRRALSVQSEMRLGKLDRAAYLLLYLLKNNSPMGIKAIAEELRLDGSTISRQIAAIEAKGYVERLPDPKDGRASLIQITPAGNEEFMLAKNARVQRFEEIFDSWTEEEMKQFASYLARLNHV
ncbi:MarR family winged helix-turn-helix transcriptional regulator [Paenibacillus guangzhouensis]|uniref:MarR family winged helix-turn-helix transcriptional regulator n=1 Tax=Paenibacillus guangzhouensis TaxID=1473112 RepID=UPI001266E28A|nr:MarR family transcriptional regulator [Paenibacillus guangzhouensis]